MTGKHTPAPWRIASAGFDDTCDNGEACYYIAAEPHMEVSMANALLISKAPELLDALRELAGLIEKVAPEYHESTMAANARALIAEIEGN